MDLSNYSLTPSAKKAIENSALIAKDFGHLKVIDLHLTSALLQFDHSNIDYVFNSNGIIKEAINQNIDHVLLNYKEPKRKKEIFSPEIKEILDFSLIQSRKFKDNYIRDSKSKIIVTSRKNSPLLLANLNSSKKELEIQYQTMLMLVTL